MQGVLVQALEKLGSGKRQRVDSPRQRQSPFTVQLGTAPSLTGCTTATVDAKLLPDLPSSTSSLHVGACQQLTATSSGSLSWGAPCAAATTDSGSDGGCGAGAASNAAPTTVASMGLHCYSPPNQIQSQQPQLDRQQPRPQPHQQRPQQQQAAAPCGSWTGMCAAPPVERQLSSATFYGGAAVDSRAAVMGALHSTPALPAAPAAGSCSPATSPCSPQMPASRCNSGCTSDGTKAPSPLKPLQTQQTPVPHGLCAYSSGNAEFSPLAPRAPTMSGLLPLPMLRPLSAAAAAGALGPSGGSGGAFKAYPAGTCSGSMGGIPTVTNLTAARNRNDPPKRKADAPLAEPEPPAAALVPLPQLLALHRQPSMQQAALSPVAAAAATGDDGSSSLALSLATAATAEMQRQLEETQQENERLMRQQELHQQQLQVLREQQRQRNAAATAQTQRNSSHGGLKQGAKKDARSSTSSAASTSKGGKGRAAPGAQRQQQQQGVGPRGTITAMHHPATFSPAYFSNPHVLMQLQTQQQQQSAFAGSAAPRMADAACHQGRSANNWEPPPVAGAAVTVASPLSRFASGELNRTSSLGLVMAPAVSRVVPAPSAVPVAAFATTSPSNMMPGAAPPVAAPAADVPGAAASLVATGGMQGTAVAAAVPSLTPAAAAELQQSTAAASLRHLQQLQQQIAELQQQIAQQAAAHVQQQALQQQPQPLQYAATQALLPQYVPAQAQYVSAQPQPLQQQLMQPLQQQQQQPQPLAQQQTQQQVPNGGWGHCFVMDEAVEADAAAEVLGLGLFMDV